MSSARSALRALIGGGLGRGYYVSSTCQTGSTSSRIIDTKRVEADGAWRGASLLVSGEEQFVTGNDPSGFLTLAAALVAGAPANTTPYELVKGWTFAQLNRAPDEAGKRAYPWCFEPLNDSTTVTELTGTSLYTLDATWKQISAVRRKVKNTASPVQWDDLVEGVDYFLRQGATGWQFEARWTTETPNALWFMGEKILTLAASDASTNRAEDSILEAGGLWWLFNEGPDPSEVASSRWEKLAERQWNIFMDLRQKLAMPRDVRPVRSPRITVTNDGQRSGIGG